MTYQEAIKHCEVYLPETDLKSFIIGILQLQIEKEEENSNHILDYITMIDAVAVYGREKQILIAVEEMSELQKALLKYLRSSHDKHVKPVNELTLDIKEEMADVSIMLQQLEIMFGDVDSEKKFKTDRLRNRLSEGRGNICYTRTV